MSLSSGSSSDFSVMELTIEQALQEGIAAHKEGKLQDAERFYRAILQSQPTHPDANHNLGVLAVSLNKANAALSLFKTALEANPKAEQFWLSYIDTLIKEQQFENAHRVIEQAKTQGVDAASLSSLESQLLPKSEKPNTVRVSPPQELLNRLLEFYQSGQFGDAEKLSIKITQEFPNHPFGWKVLSAIYGQLGRYAEALDICKKSLQLAPGDPEAHSNLGVTLQKLKRLDEAEASCMQAIALRPDYADAYSNLGVTLKELGRLDEALASYSQAIALNPDYAEAHNNLGNALRELGRLDEAETSYKKAIELKPDYAGAHSNLGITLQELGRLDEAANAFRTSYTHDPGSHMSLFHLHSTYYRDMNPDFGAAIKCLDDAVQIAPSDGSVNFFLGMLSDYIGQEKKSKRYFSFVQEDMPGSHAQLDSWNWIKSKTSRYPLLFWQKYDGFDYAFDAAQLDGLILEFGVGHGKSIRRLASKTDQFIHGFDSFEGLPESWAHLPKGAFNRSGHAPLAPDHVKFHVGLFSQTLPAFLIKNEDPIKFLNIDCDLYSSTKTIFDLIESRIVAGTVIFFDEYLGFKDWRNHEFKAFQEAVKRNGWLYDYLAINMSGYNAVVIIR